MREQVTLAYHRPPDRTDRFVQELVFESDDVLVTFLARTPLQRPMIIDGQVALEPDAPVVWFTFPGAMHDIGRFHTAAGRFTGIYADIIEPVEVQSRLNWRVTDLCLDIWLPAGGVLHILDRNELAVAVATGAISAEAGARAEAEAHRLVMLHGHGSWPPAIVNEWPLERVLKEL